MKRPSLLFLFLLFVLLSCTPIRKESPSADTSPNLVPARRAQVKVPPSALTPNLMYELLAGEIAGQRGDLQDAARYYLEAASSTKDPRVAERAARIALFARDKERAMSATRLWVKLAPDSAEAKQVLVLLLFNEGKYDAALEHLEKIAAAKDKQPLEKFLQVASLLERAQDQKAGLALMEKLVAKYPDSPEALFAYSHVAAHAGDLTRAQKIIDQALARKPDWPDAAVLRARIMHLQNKTGEALEYLQGLAHRYPQERALQLGYARLLIDSNRLDDAIAQFQALAKASPEDDEVQFALGLLLLQANHADEAQQYLEKLVKAGKRASEASFFLGQIAESKQHMDEAKGWYQRVQGGDYFIDSQIRLAAILARQGDVAAALERLRGMQVRTREDASRLFLAQGEILAAAGRMQEALTVYSTAIGKLPQDTDLLYARALLAEKIGNLSQTEEDLRRILSLEPDNAQALNALGYTLADRTDRHQEALGYVSRALELKPNDPFILDSMGWVFYRLGNYQESVKYLRKALDAQDDAEIAAHLGEVLWVSGDKGDARQVWDRALKTHPDSRPLREVMQRLVQ